MRLHIMLLVLALAAGAASGQEKKPEEAARNDSGFEAAIIPVKTLTGDSFDRLVKLLGVFNARFTADDKLRTIVVYAPKDVVAEMRRVIAELDRPGSLAAIGRNINLTLSFLKCATKPATAANPLPADLEPVAKQLRAATQYKDVQLWDIVPMRLQEGKTTEQTLRLPGSLSGNPSAFPTAEIRVLPESVGRKDAGRYVRFSDLTTKFRIPTATTPAESQSVTRFRYVDVGVRTAGDFMEGQKSVLGKVSGLDDESAIFVVIELKILD